MSAELSTKPYLIRAIVEWCADAGHTPYVSVRVDQNVRVPLEFVKNGEIVLSISSSATRNLTISSDLLQFTARFGGVSREISVPMYAIQGVFARENGRGAYFEPEATPTNVVEAAPPLQAVPVTADTPAPDARDASDHPKGTPRGNLRVIK